jgi:hypothetical protein
MAKRFILDIYGGLFAHLRARLQCDALERFRVSLQQDYQDLLQAVEGRNYGSRYRNGVDKKPEKLPSENEIGETYLTKKCYGVFGIIDLLETSYVAVMDRCTLMGYLLRAPVLRIDSLFFCAVNKQISPDAAAKNATYLNMINECVQARSLYFSPELNMTLRMQSLINGIAANTIRPASDHVSANTDARFFFNRVHCQFFLDNMMYDMITPTIQGFFAVP